MNVTNGSVMYGNLLLLFYAIKIDSVNAARTVEFRVGYENVIFSFDSRKVERSSVGGLYILL